MIDNEFYIELYENKTKNSSTHMSVSNQFDLSVHKYIQHGELNLFIKDLEKTWSILEKNASEVDFFFSYDYDKIIFMSLILNKNLFKSFANKFNTEKEQSKYKNFLIFNYFFYSYKNGSFKEDILNTKIDKNRKKLFSSIIEEKDYEVSKSINLLVSASRKGINDYADPIFLEGLIFIWLLKSKKIGVNLNEKSKIFLPQELCDLSIEVNFGV